MVDWEKWKNVILSGKRKWDDVWDAICNEEAIEKHDLTYGQVAALRKMFPWSSRIAIIRVRKGDLFDVLIAPPTAVKDPDMIRRIYGSDRTYKLACEIFKKWKSENCMGKMYIPR